MSISFSLSPILTLLGQPYSFQLQCLSPAVPQCISPGTFSLLGIHFSSFSLSLSALLSPPFLLFLYLPSIAHFISLIIKLEITWCVQWLLWVWYAPDVEVECNGKDKCSITTAPPPGLLEGPELVLASRFTAKLPVTERSTRRLIIIYSKLLWCFSSELLKFCWMGIIFLSMKTEELSHRWD